MLGDPRETQYEREIYKFDRLAQIPDTGDPTFVFAHFLLPHPPYIFNRDGSFREPSEGVSTALKMAYVDQLVATNAKVEALVDELLGRSSVPPIIIIQGG